MRAVATAVVLTLLAAGSIRAEQPQTPQAASTGEISEALPAHQSEPPAHYQAVLDLIEAERQDVEALSQQLQAATDIQDMMRLEKAIGARRERLQMELLELRLAQALELGRADVAEQIRAHIQLMKNPAPLPQKSTEARTRVRPN